MRTPASRVTAALLGCAAVVAGALLVTGDRVGAAGTGGTLYGWGENSGGQVGIDWVTDTVVPRTVVPSVLGDVDAAQVLHTAGLVEGNVSTTPDDRYCNRIGQIKTQSPAAGTLAVFGSRVDVTVYVRPAQPCL